MPVFIKAVHRSKKIRDCARGVRERTQSREKSAMEKYM